MTDHPAVKIQRLIDETVLKLSSALASPKILREAAYLAIREEALRDAMKAFRDDPEKQE